MRKQGWYWMFVCAVWMGGGLSAKGATIIAYDGSNSPTTAAASEVWPGVTPLDLSRGAGLNAGSGGTFNSTGWNDEATDYLEWGWSASQPIDLTDLDMRYDRSASGPSMLDLQLSVNGGVFTSIFSDAAVDDAGEEALDIDLTAYTGVTSAVFRLFGTGASSGTGTFDLEPLSGIAPPAAIQVAGSAAPVPEPRASALAIIAALGLLLARRR